MSAHPKHCPVSHRSRHKNRTYIHLPFAYRVRRKEFYRFIVTSVLLLAFTVLIPWAIYCYTLDASVSAGSQIVEPTGVVPYASLEPLLDRSPIAAASVLNTAADANAQPAIVSLASILAKYRTATGLREVQSLLLHGSYLEDGRKFEMKLAAKAPNLVSKNLSDDELEMVCRYNGSKATIEIATGAPGQAVTQALEDAIYERAIILEGAFLSLADFGTELLTPRYAWQADQMYDGKPCWTVVSQLPGTPEISHLLDQESGFELVRYLDLVVEGSKHQLSIHFSDFRQHDALHLPHAYTLKVNGAIRGQARVDSIQRNPGLMPWMF